MRIDPETGALDAGLWRIDPREPQSSFVQWARAAGFRPGYLADVDEWFVYAAFSRHGVLRRVRLSRDHDHPYQEQVKALEDWLAGQRWPRGTTAELHWDKFFSDGHVGVDYDLDAPVGPPPEPDDLALIARAPSLSFGAVDDDLTLTVECVAFERLFRRPPPIDDVAEVVRDGTAAGRVYAALLLPDEVRPDALSVLRDDPSPLTTDHGLTTVADFVRHSATL